MPLQGFTCQNCLVFYPSGLPQNNCPNCNNLAIEDSVFDELTPNTDFNGNPIPGRKGGFAVGGYNSEM